VAGAFTGGSAGADPATVLVTVNARSGLASVPDTGIGVNHAVWDSELGTEAVSDLLRSAGVDTMRYPGGSYADIYHWADNTAPGGYVAPNTDFDTFMAGVRRAGAQAIVIANYGTGSPEEAADWVYHANVANDFGVKFWEIGNELYGNGHYGNAWEADDHVDKSPTAYADEVVAYAEAMKAVDPTIQIGAVLTTPAGWPDGVVADGDGGTWNDVVLSIAGPSIDFAILHWYPGGATAAEALAKPAQIDDLIYLVRRQIAGRAGAAAAARIRIAVTEFNVGTGKNTQPGALFAADTYTGLLENGVFTVNFWDVHNGPSSASTIGGQTDYDDWGLLSSAGCLPDGTCEPALNTPFAPFHALQMLSTFARPGDQLVRAASGQALVSAHAARRPDGDLAVLLINKDPDNAQTVAIDYSGFAPSSSSPTVYAFTNGAVSITVEESGSATSRILPPYSLTALVVHPASIATDGPSAPAQPSATSVSHRTATFSWPAAVAGSHPIAKYEVYRQNGASSDLLGETPGLSFTVHNLEPGTRYTVNVLARDTAGNLSLPSPPLAITTGSPAQSNCTVRLTDVTNWGSGFVASVDITNAGPAAIDGWTLTFNWPTTWQHMDGGWNGTWTQTGTGVLVTNGDFNRQLAPSGGSANIGFVGSYSGPNILPPVFTLNGTVCTTL
jgi:chitodextrinase